MVRRTQSSPLSKSTHFIFFVGEEKSGGGLEKYVRWSACTLILQIKSTLAQGVNFHTCVTGEYWSGAIINGRSRSPSRGCSAVGAYNLYHSRGGKRERIGRGLCTANRSLPQLRPVKGWPYRFYVITSLSTVAVCRKHDMKP